MKKVRNYTSDMKPFRDCNFCSLQSNPLFKMHTNPEEKLAPLNVSYRLFFIQDIDECVSSPCLNNGTCTDGVNTFTCTCEAGMQGNVCQEGTSFYPRFNINHAGS